VIAPGDSLFEGRYRVLRRLGEGGFGDVFLVQETSLARTAVLKVSREADPEAFERLAREYRVIEQLGDPAFARVYEVGRFGDDRSYLVTEWVDGLTLQDILSERGRLPLGDAVTVALTLARGLGRLHDAGFVHRDVKPSNIMIPGEPGERAFAGAKLLDLGVLGVLVRRGNANLTMSGVFVGTPRYMSPEQVQALPQSPATDVYGLGLVLFEALYGRLPFEDDAESAVALMLRIMQTDPVVPEDPAIPAGLRDLLARCLSRDPTLRPPDGAALAEELERFVPRRAEQTVAGAAPVRATGALAAPSVLPAPRRPSRPSGGVPALAAPRVARRWTVVVLAAVIGGAGIAAAALTLARTRPDSRIGPDTVTVLPPPPPPVRAPSALPWILGGVAAAAAGLLGAALVRKQARKHIHLAEVDVSRLLLGLKTKRALSETLQIEVEQILASARGLDERILGVTILKMIAEYDAATASDDRQAALMNLSTLMEKLRTRLSPLYARFEKQLALASTMVGVVSGVVSVVTGVLKIVRRTP